MSLAKSESLAALAPALAKAQAEFGTVEKAARAEVPTRSGGKFSYTYATLTDVLEAVLPVLNSNGISVQQWPGWESGMVTLETVLMHVSGEWMAASMAMPVAGDGAQAAGSAITYARRYALASILGLKQDDDDGAAATAPPAPRAQQAKPAEKPKYVNFTSEELRAELDKRKITLAMVAARYGWGGTQPVIAHTLDMELSNTKRDLASVLDAVTHENEQASLDGVV